MSNTPIAPANIAAAVIDPKSYTDWDNILDTFDVLRRDTPVARIENGDLHDPFWLVTGYDDVMRISKDNAAFLNNPRSAVFGLSKSIDFIRSVTGGSPHLVESLVTMDGAVHKNLRKLTQMWFMPANLRKLEDGLGKLAKETVDKLLAEGGNADFVPLVSAPFPLHVIMEILGVPKEDEQRMFFLTQKMFGERGDDAAQPGMAEMTPEQITQLITGAVADFEAYFSKLTAEKRANPTEDVASVIANATIDGKQLDDRTMAGYYIITASAGHDTTSASIAGAMQALANDPEQWQLLKANRGLLPGLIEEAIRWTSPVQHFMRTAAEDVEISGVKIPKGDWLMLSYAAANHDGSAFENPRKFDISRSSNRHLAFGAGAHQCLGLHLARMEMKILFNELLDRIDTIEPVGEVKRAQSVFVGGLKTLPLEFTASS